MSTIISADFKKKSRASADKEENKVIGSYEFHLEIAFSNRQLWRRVRIPGTATLHTLHQLIQACFGWQDDAPHRFLVGKIFYGPRAALRDGSCRFDETTVELHELEEGMGFIFTYLYDQGSGWECEISLDRSLPATEPGAAPVIVAGEYASPPAQYDDIHEYMALLNLHERTSAPEKAALMARHGLPDDFDPTSFDLASARQQLAGQVQR